MNLTGFPPERVRLRRSRPECRGCESTVPRARARGAAGRWARRCWEYGADRAFQFAKRERDRGRVKRPTVVGALINWYLDFAAANTDKVYDTVRCAFIEGDLLYSLRSRRPVANGVGPAIARVSVGERHDARPWPGGRA